MRWTLALALLGPALAAALAACKPYAHLTEGPTAPAVGECGHCHVAVYDEWLGSTHARAWTNPVFVETTSNRAIESCLGCHAPDSIFVEGAPALRATRRDEGVTCIACHLDGGVLAGPAPTSALVEPHPIAAERELYRSSELCGKCHEGTWREWSDAPAEERRTCQDCHMPGVTRTLTQGTNAFSRVLVAFEDEFEGRRHTFAVEIGGEGEDVVRTELVEARREGEELQVVLEVENRIPHRVPTGDFGFRRITVDVRGSDAQGRSTGQRAWELYKELGTSLAAGETRRFEVAVGSATESVSLVLSRSARTGPAQIVHQQEWSLP